MSELATNRPERSSGTILFYPQHCHPERSEGSAVAFESFKAALLPDRRQYSRNIAPALFRLPVFFRVPARNRSNSVFSYTRCVKIKLLKWVLVWGALGLVIPAVLILRWKLTGSSFGQVELILWPSSILTMGLDAPSPRSNSDIVEVYAALIAMNGVLYLLVGLLTCPLFILILRRRKPITTRLKSSS
jgi:hypothetical protein